MTARKSFTALHLAAFAALVALAQPVAQAAPTLAFTPPAGPMLPGSTFSVALLGSDFDDTIGGAAIDNVTGGQGLALSFSAGLLELLSVSIDPRWNFSAAAKPGTIDNVAGTLNGMGFGSFPATTDDSFAIAKLEFRALGPGDATLSVTAAQIVGRVGGVGASTINATLPMATLSVSAVPEPSTATLMAGALGLAAVGRLLRRRTCTPGLPTERSP